MKLLIPIFVLILSCFSLAQTNAYLKHKTLMIGEQTELIYEFRYPKNSKQVNYSPFKNTIPIKNKVEGDFIGDIEILKKFKDTLITKNGISTWIGSYTITAWDSGYFVIPESYLKFEDSTYYFQPLLIQVKFPKKIEGKELYDIKENFESIPYTISYWLKKYGWILLFLIALIILFIVYKKRNKNKIQRLKTGKTNLEITLEELESLRLSKLWLNNELKLHYITLSHILRTFLTQNFNLNLMEKTSEETSLLLKDKLNTKQLQSISYILAYSDLIKFAKASPDNEQTALEHINQVKEIVEELAKSKHAI
jgi:hypothetical protein